MDEEFRNHLLGGIVWAAGKKKKLDYSKAYATSPDDEVKRR
jgi:hypothetical protein